MAERSFIEQWSLTFDDLEFVNGYRKTMRIWVALQLKFFCLHGYFPTDHSDIASDCTAYLAEQMGCSVSDQSEYQFKARAARRHNQDVLRHLGFHRATDRDKAALKLWLNGIFRDSQISFDNMVSQAFGWCHHHKVYIPSHKIMARFVGSVRRAFKGEFLASVTRRLSSGTITKLEASLADPMATTGFQRLKDDVGAAALENMLSATERLAFIRDLNLPMDMLEKVDRAWIDRLVRRVGGETASEMRRHGFERRMGLYAVYLMARNAQLIDGVADLLIELIHRIGTRSRRKVIMGISREIEKVHGKGRFGSKCYTPKAADLQSRNQHRPDPFPKNGAHSLLTEKVA